jgi:hypothetical protein
MFGGMGSTEVLIKRLIDRRLRLMRQLLKGPNPEKAEEVQEIWKKLQKAGIQPQDSYHQDANGKITSITGTTWTQKIEEPAHGATNRDQ